MLIEYTPIMTMTCQCNYCQNPTNLAPEVIYRDTLDKDTSLKCTETGKVYAKECASKKCPCC